MQKIGIVKLSDDTDSIDVVVTHAPPGFDSQSRIVARLKDQESKVELFITEHESVSFVKTLAI